MADPTNADDFLRLWTRHEPQIRGRVLLWVPNWNDAQDVTQQVSFALWRKFDEYDRSRSFVAWAVGIARLEVKDHWRRKGRDQQLFSDRFIDVVADDATAMAEEIEHRRSLLKRCLDKLKPADRELLSLRYLHDQPVPDIAARLNRSVEAVYKSAARLRSALVECVSRQMTIADRR
jgi:RNA polymerase sigma-70 factor (ECF subfamily)